MRERAKAAAVPRATTVEDDGPQFSFTHTPETGPVDTDSNVKISYLSRYESLSSCTIKNVTPNGHHFRVNVLLKGLHRSVRTPAMIDSGATGLFLNRKFVRRHGILLEPLKQPIRLTNIDGSLNVAGSITHYASLRLTVGDNVEKAEFLVTDLGPEDVILGLPWLQRTNPDIDWEQGEMHLDHETPSEEGPEIASTGENPDRETPAQEGLEDETPFYRINANRAERRRLTKIGILEHSSEEVWCAAGYTHSQRIAEEADKAKNARTFEEVVPEQYRDFASVFSEKESERLPERRPWDHAIDLKPGAPETVRSKVYPMSVNEQGELDKFIEDQLRKGYIVPSKSALSSPVFFIKKKDGKLRLVQDYRKLNEITVKNRYPLPLASDIINRLRGAKHFTKFDVRWGYNNVRIKEGDEWKAAFSTSRGLYEPLVMFFGLTNSPATFQALMNSVFSDLIVRGVVAVYLDDILIFTETLEEHREVVREVLRRLQANDLYLRPEKCEFEKTEIEYLGMIIREGHVSMDSAKVRAVTDWAVPENLKQVRGFVGFANFYRRFIKDFATITRPLHDLTKKDTPWRWEAAEQKAFDTLKEAFTTEPILSMWEPDRPTRVESDASGFATGGVLSQKQDDGLWHPIAYRSESMSEAERNYEIYDREMLGVIRALEDWRHFLEGLPEPFEIITDHRNLEYWKSAQNLTRRQARWHIWLSRFDFKITHKPGSTMLVADPLSRQGNHAVSDTEDNQSVVVLKPQHFAAVAATHFKPDALEKRIRVASEREAEVVQGLENLRKHGPRKLTDGSLEWEEDDGLVYYKGRLFIPNSGDLRTQIVKSCHDAITAGHPGKNGTIELVSRHYWWPRMTVLIAKYVAGCDRCQRYKPAVHRVNPLQPHDVPQGMWQIVGVDLITGLPECKGKDAILTYVDLYSKMTHILAVTSTITAEGVADCHYREIFPKHGIPHKIVSDRGPQFAARTMRALYKALGIDSGLTTAYHPQANGQTERMNKEVESYLRLFCGKRQDDWVDLLPTAEFVINSRLNSSTGHTPFELVYGYHPDFTVPVGRSTKMPALDQRLNRLREVRADAEAAMRLSKEKMKDAHTPGHIKPREFAVGDKVWLASKNIKIHQASLKLGPRQLGPYEVLERVGDLDYRLKLPPALKVHNVFHVDRLSPWGGNDVNGQIPPPPEAVKVDGEEEYLVDEILDSRVFRRQLQYLVKWEGYDEGENSWEPAKLVTHAKAKVTAFHKRHPSAPRRVNATVFATLPWRSIGDLSGGTGTDLEWETGRIPGVPSQIYRRDDED